jgi:hypothetical protein
MSVLDFPTSPTNGQYYNGFVWNAANETWDSAFAPRPATVPIATPNVIINGAFDINQRNFTSGTASGTFGFDRWLLASDATLTTYSAQTFPLGTSLGGFTPTNFARLVTSGQSASSVFSILAQRIEDVRTLAGETVTVSFWARAASGTPKVAVELEQIFGTGGSPSAGVTGIVGQVTLSTSWARHSVTLTVPSVSGKTLGTNPNTSYLTLSLWVSAGSNFNTRSGSLGIQSNTFDFWGVQVEGGAAPTEFRRNAPSIQGELAACQRYYFRFTQLTNFRVLGTAYSWNSSETLFTMSLPVNLRTESSGGSISSVSGALFLGNNTNYTGATLQAIYATTNTLTIVFNLTTPMNQTTLFRPVSGSFFEVTAEL